MAQLESKTALVAGGSRYCARMIGSVVDAEDLVQEALTKAYAALPATSVVNVRAWLFRIAHNKAIDYLRRASHQQLKYLV